jgi:hypothetical protein
MMILVTMMTPMSFYRDIMSLPSTSTAIQTTEKSEKSEKSESEKAEKSAKSEKSDNKKPKMILEAKYIRPDEIEITGVTQCPSDDIYLSIGPPFPSHFWINVDDDSKFEYNWTSYSSKLFISLRDKDPIYQKCRLIFKDNYDVLIERQEVVISDPFSNKRNLSPSDTKGESDRHGGKEERIWAEVTAKSLRQKRKQLSYHYQLIKQLRCNRSLTNVYGKDYTAPEIKETVLSSFNDTNECFDLARQLNHLNQGGMIFIVRKVPVALPFEKLRKLVDSCSDISEVVFPPDLGRDQCTSCWGYVSSVEECTIVDCTAHVCYECASLEFRMGRCNECLKCCKQNYDSNKVLKWKLFISNKGEKETKAPHANVANSSSIAAIPAVVTTIPTVVTTIPAATIPSGITVSTPTTISGSPSTRLNKKRKLEQEVDTSLASSSSSSE